MDGLTELHGAIRDFSDPMVVMRRVVDQALILIPAAEGAVVELAHEGSLTYVCTAGTLAEYVGTRLRLEGSLSGLSVRTGETQCCQDSATDGRVDGEACRAVGAVSMVCVPLRRDSKPIGVLKVSSALAHAFTAQDAATLASLAEFISIAIAAATDISRITDELSADVSVGEAASNRAQDSDPGVIEADPNRAGVSKFIANVLRPGSVGDLAIKQRIERVLTETGLAMQCQPIVHLHTGELVGAEALARFPGPPHQSPDVWFSEADAVGLGVELQLAAVEVALELGSDLAKEAFLAFNIGPDAISHPRLTALLGSQSPERLVLELTEHLRVEDYPQLRSVLRTIRASGVRLAIDDTGAGFASLGNIVNLAPDLIKLDRQFTSGIDLDPVRRALAHALVNFATDTGAQVIAEGIENKAEFDTVRELGIPYGQGYFIARPSPIGQMPRRFPHLAPQVAAARRCA